MLIALAGTERIFEVMDEKPEVDDGYVTLVNMERGEDGQLREADHHTGLWAWKHPHKTGGLDYTPVTGDVVFAQSPTMVCWPDGRMGDYLASLDVLGRLVAERGVERLLTGHGPVIENPSERIEQARRHRLQRLQQVVSAVRSGIPADAEALVEAVYNDVRPELHDGAVRSVNAQLRYAFDEGILQENR